MHIGFDAKRYFNNTTGLGNYARWLVDGIIEHTDTKPFLYHTKVEKTSPEYTLHTPQGMATALPFVWRSKLIINDLKKDGIAIYHGLSNELPFGIHKTSIKSIVTIHDLIHIRYPEYYKPLDRFIYNRKVHYAQHHADVIVVPSEQTKTDLKEFYNTSLSKIKVIPLSVPDFENNMATCKNSNTILCVSSFSKRKNIVRLVKAFAQVEEKDVRLVIAGSSGDTKNEIQNLVKNDSRIHLQFDVTTDELTRLYNNSLFTIYPSEFEGFGIPILESFCYGKTVATSGTSSMPEVGGKAAMYFEPTDIQSITNSITQLLHPEVRKKYESKIPEQLAIFESKKLINEYISLYKNLE